VKVLVTGADGFVGNWVIRRLLNDGREVFGAVRPAQGTGHETLTAEEQAAVRWLPLEVTESESVRKCAELLCDSECHLAAVASRGEAADDPGFAGTSTRPAPRASRTCWRSRSARAAATRSFS